MDKSNPVFKKTYRNYLKEIGNLDLNRIAPLLGGVFVDSAIELVFFDGKYSISAEGIFDEDEREAPFSEAVVLSKYLLMCPDKEPVDTEWVGYNSFKDAAPFAEAFRNNVEKQLACHFEGKAELLKEVCNLDYSSDFDLEASYTLVKKFDILPRVPMLLMFNESDEEFSAEAFVRFEKRAEKYLDMECLAILGWLLSDRLIEKAGLMNKPLM